MSKTKQSAYFLQEANGLGLAQVPSLVTQLAHTVISSGGLSAGAERSESCEPGCLLVTQPWSLEASVWHRVGAR